MHYWGTLLGSTFGLLVGGPLGALLGAAAGYDVDKELRRHPQPSDQERLEAAFFTASFLIMGHLAKADGRVSEKEIIAARIIMAQMGLTAEQQKAAINLFNKGKQSDFPLEAVITQFRHESQCRYHTVRRFIEIQMRVACADGALSRNKRELLLYLCRRLNFSRFQLETLESAICAGYRSEPKYLSLIEAYAILGLAPSVSDVEIKRTYRRLMNRYHPDKLAANKLSNELIDQATEKTQEIQAAYDRIKADRNKS